MLANGASEIGPVILRAVCSQARKIVAQLRSSAGASAFAIKNTFCLEAVDNRLLMFGSSSLDVGLN